MTKETKWLVGLSCIAIPSALVFLFLQIALLLAPMSWWIVYESVEPLSDKVMVGTKPRFLSKVTVNRKCNLHYNDILFCKPDGAEKFTYTQEYFSTTYGKQLGREENEWQYGHKVWTQGKCYLKSNIILRLPFSVEKVQTYISKEFEVVP